MRPWRLVLSASGDGAVTDDLGSLFLKPCVGAGGSWHDTEVVGDRDDDQIVCGFEELAHLCLSLVAP